MVFDAAHEFIKTKTPDEEAPRIAIDAWVATGNFERWFRTWRDNMYTEMIQMADLGDEPDLYISAILYDPPTFGFTYNLYKAMTSERRLTKDFKLTMPDLAKIRAEL